MSLMELLPKSKLERKRVERNKVAIGAVIGVAVGAVAGVLLAPKAGKLTRQELAEKIHELPERTMVLATKTQQIIGDAKEKITEETKKIVSGAKEKVVDIHEAVQEAVQEEARFLKPTEITEEQVVAFKHKLK
jgi:gas vesicle protein